MDYFAWLSKHVCPKLKLGLLHGRLSSEEKEAVMQSFRKNETQILVAPTVVEVGVDVPNATVMVIEHAERFGLAQLHQLRGRIGRGAQKSHCILVAPFRMTDEARASLETMVRTSNGFEIAETDLLLRGPGEFFGTRQSGDLGFHIANPLRAPGTFSPPPASPATSASPPPPPSAPATSSNLPAAKPSPSPPIPPSTKPCSASSANSPPNGSAATTSPASADASPRFHSSEKRAARAVYAKRDGGPIAVNYVPFIHSIDPKLRGWRAL